METINNMPDNLVTSSPHNLIPKVIHYCWFGRGVMPELVQDCITSWHTHMPDWKYQLWNEDNFDVSTAPQYVQEAYAAKKYAFVSDYVRLWALEREGGLYMDVDFEVYKPFDDLMEQYDAFAGYEGSKRNPVMMGVIAAKAHHPWIQGMMQTYESRVFLKEDSSLDMTPNTGYFLSWMQERGFIADGVEKDWSGVHILPVECFCPGLTTGENLRCERTYCEHKGLHSWSGNGGWKNKVLSLVSPQMKSKLIKLKRKILG